ncbi:MAG: helix-turn-helix domain-containing protein [Anaerolineae bacterium]
MYRLFKPHPVLQTYIESYWSIQALEHPITLREQVFVDGRADVLFNFGAPYLRHPLHQPRADQLGFSNVDGQRDYPLVIVQEGHVNLVGIRFRPGGLTAFLRQPVDAVGNLTLEVQQVWGKAAYELEGRLFDARTSQQTTTLLDTFFLNQLHNTTSYQYIRYVAQEIEQQGGSLSIMALSRESGYSIRTVDRLFRRHYGTTPKFYARIVRFQRVLALLSRNSDLPLTQIALMCSYYDHAHLTHQFTAFTGASPDQYRDVLRARLQTPPPNLAQYFA